MRTSRISRETAKVVDALSPARRTSARRSLRAFANESEAGLKDGVKEEEANGVERELLIPASTPGSNGTNTPNSSLGKRKRQLANTPTTSIIAESTTVRRSPRKEVKTEEEDGTPKRKIRRLPAKHIKGPNGDVTLEPPPNWEQVYNITAAMRKRILAPVDTMGCESLAEETRSPLDRRLQTLVALMLSSQTKDTVTAAAMKNLQDNLPGGFNLEALLQVPPDDLNNLIGKVGFHNNKTKFLKSAAVILRDQHKGDIPDTIEGLTALPGVGPKMAYLCMSAAWGRDEGIGVDVHVHRITNLWGWHKTSTPEQTRAELEAWLPREKWHAINHLLVGFGQTVCLPVGRKCGSCDLAVEGLCPSATMTPAKIKKVKREVEVKVEEDDTVEKVGEVVVQADDVGVKVEADTVDEGKIEVQASAGAADLHDT